MRGGGEGVQMSAYLKSLALGTRGDNICHRKGGGGGGRGRGLGVSRGVRSESACGVCTGL